METIALNKLVQWEGNVRKTGASEGLDELVASIAAHGLLNPLTIQKAGKGKFAVVAGQRRLMALGILAKRGDIEMTAPIECIEVAEGADPAEISLAENVVRASMHPADQFDAWRDLADKGLSVTDIAARFGVAEAVVAKRLKLGRVNPKLLDYYRKGEMSLEQVQAFTVSDNQAEQLRVWNSLQGWKRQPSGIREALTKDEIPATDRRVKLVGLDAYESAGGAVRRDLFDDRNAGWVSNVQLLDKLVDEKLQTVVEDVQAEGWKWVELRPQFDSYSSAYHREFASRDHGKEVPLTPEEKAEVKALKDELKPLEAIDSYQSDDDLTEEQANRKDKIEDRLSQFNHRPSVYSKAAMKRGGAVVTLDYEGLEIVRGLVKKDDSPKEAGGAGSRATNDVKPKSPYSQSLKESLTKEVTGAMQAELAANPKLALIALLHSLSTQYGSPVNVTCSARSCTKASLAEDAMSTARAKADEGAPDQYQSQAAWDWLADQTQERLLEILAYHVAHTVDAGASNAGTLRAAQSLDLRKWFTPDAENYFGKIGKDQILVDLEEMGVAVTELKAFANMKKGELAKAAARVASENATDWLPAPMRGSTDPAGEMDADDEECDELDEAA